MGRYKKVEGYPNLLKDEVTGAVINTNKKEVEIAKARKKKFREQSEMMNRVNDDVEGLKSDVKDIKDLLNKLIERL